MNVIAILGIAVGLAMDALAVAICAGIRLGGATPRQLFRFSFHFGLFQAGMPLVGWLAGREFLWAIDAWDHWIAFGLLAGVGGKELLEARSASEISAAPGDPTRGWSLVALSVATSLDALAVGLSFALLDVAIWYPCAVIGLVTGGLTLAGMRLGRRLGLALGRRLRALGGILLLGIGVKILVQGLSS